MSRAQSDTLGFVLVFTLIVLTVGGVYVGGYGALEDVRTAEQLHNMERAFDVLDDNFEDITEEGAPSRATELKLNGGTLSVGGSATVVIENASRNFTVSRTTAPVVYRRGDDTVALSFGAVFRGGEDGAVVREEPGWLVRDGRLFVPLTVTARTGDTRALGGRSTVLVAGDTRSRSVRTLAAAPGDTVAITVTVTSPRAAAWNRYLDSLGLEAVDSDPSDGTVVYRTSVERVTVQTTQIGVELRR